MEYIVELKRVTKIYSDQEKKFQVLNGIDLKVRKGDFISVKGPSGSGKTTFLNILGGNLQPSSGEVIIGGLPLHLLDENSLNSYRKSYCGMLWQDAHENLIPELTVEENIEHVMMIGGYPIEKRKKRIEFLLESFDIKSRAKHKLHQLSGGEALRASLAASMVNEPELLLCDEPTGELDSETSRMIIDFLKKVNKEIGTTIIVVTHDELFDLEVNMTFDLKDGNLVLARAPNTIAEDPKQVIAFMNAIGQIQIPPHLLPDKGRFFKIEKKGESIVLIPIMESTDY